MSIHQLETENFYNINTGTILINGEDDTTSESTGALIVEGGVVIKKQLRVIGGIVADETHYASTTDSTSISTGAVVVAGGVGVAKNVYVGQNLHVAGDIYATQIHYESEDVVTSTINSTSTSTGALIIAGGAGIAKDTNIGGNTRVWATTGSSSTSTGALIVDGGCAIKEKLNVASDASMLNVNINSTTNATDTATGALKVSGGASIIKDLHVGGTIYGNVDGAFSTGTIEATSTSTGSLIVNGGIGIAKNTYIGGHCIVESNEASTSYTTGGVVITGGLGVGNNINAFGNLNISGTSTLRSASITNTTESTSLSTGTVTVGGGVGVAKSLHSGGVYVHNQSTPTYSGSITIDGSGVMGIENGGLGIKVNEDINSTGGAIFTTNVSTGSANITDATGSTSKTTGALVVGGGVGINEKLYVGSDANVAGAVNSATLAVSATTEASGTNSGVAVISGGVGIAKKLYVGGNANVSGAVNSATLAVSATTEASGTNSGVAVISGGAGIAKKLYVGGDANISGAINGTTMSLTTTTESTTSSVGAVLIGGGVGIAKNLNVGGAVYSQTNVVANMPHGFENQTDSTMSYNSSTNTFSIAPASSSFNVWVNGKKYTYSTTQSLAHTATVGIFYYYFSASGLAVSPSVPNYNLYATCAVVFFYNASTYFITEERHDCRMDTATHKELHDKIGGYTSACSISSYTLSPATPTDSHNQFAMSSGTFYDEGLATTINALSSGSYKISYLTGPSANWIYKSLTVPLSYTTTGYIEYNQLTGGSWTLTPLSNNQWVNYYVIIVPSLTSGTQVFCKAGQTVYTTLADASEESPISLIFSGYAPPEYHICYKITFRTSNTYNTLGKCRIEAVQTINLSQSMIISGSTINNHNSLLGLQLAEAGTTWGHINDSAQTIAGIKTFSDTTDSTSITTGSLLASGGIGIAKKLHIGDNLVLHNITDTTKTSTLSVDTSGAMTINSSGNICYFDNTDKIVLLGTVDETSTSTGTLIVNGGVSIAKSALVNGSLTATNTLTSGARLRSAGAYIELGSNVSTSTLRIEGYKSLNADYTAGTGGTTATTGGTGTTPSISNGKISINTNSYVQYPAGAGVDGGTVGTVRFKYTSLYTGYPSSDTVFTGREESNINNNICLYHGTDGLLHLFFNSSTGYGIIAYYFSSNGWSAIANREYEFEFNFDIGDGNTGSGTYNLFIDGVKFGNTLSNRAGTGMTRVALTSVRFGTTLTGAFLIRDIAWFSTVQHTANYDAGFSTNPAITAPSLRGNTLEVHNTTDWSKSATMTVDTSGAFNVDASGNVVNINSTDTVNILSSIDSTDGYTGSLQVYGGASFKKQVQVQDNIENIIPPNATFYVSGKSTNIDFIYGTGTNAWTATTGTVSISNGKLRLEAGAYLSKTITGLTGVVGNSTTGGCIRFKFTPHYSGSPTDNTNRIIGTYATGGGNYTHIDHLTTGNLSVYLSNSTGGSGSDNDLGAWSPTADTEYEFELNYNTQGTTYLFINGVLQGSVTKAFTQTDVRTYIILGFVGTGYSSQAQSYRDVCFYTSTRHTTAYTPPTTMYPSISLTSTALNCRNAIQLFNPVFPTQYTSFTTGTDGSLAVNSTGNIISFDASDVVRVLATVDETSTSTGSLIVNGGASFAKSVLVNGSLTSTNTMTTNARLRSAGIYVEMPSNVSSASLRIEAYKSIIANYSAGTGSTTPTTSGTIAISNGKMSIGANSYVQYPAGTGVDGGNTGAIRWKYTPSYSGAPSAHTYFFGFLTSSANNIAVNHRSDGYIGVQVVSSANANLIYTYYMYAWTTAVAGTEYEFEFDWDGGDGAQNNGLYSLFINGVLVGQRPNGSSTTTRGVASTWTFGGSSGVAFSIRDICMFTTVQHTASYDAGYATNPSITADYIRSSNTLEVHNSSDWTQSCLLTVGSSGNLSVNSSGGIVNLTGTVASTSTSTGALTVGGGVGIGGKANIYNMSIIATTNSTDTSTGSLTVGGGASIVKDVFIGGNLNVAGSLNIPSFTISTTTESTSLTTGALAINGGLGVVKSLNTGHLVAMKNDSGAVMIVEGANTINPDVYVGTQTSTPTTSGTVAIVNNKIKLNAGAKMTYLMDSSLDGSNGTLRFKYVPAYATKPTSGTNYLFSLGVIDGSNNISLGHGSANGELYLKVYDNNGTALNNASLGNWSCTLNQTYEFEIDWSISNSATAVRVFKDGVQFGSTVTTNFATARNATTTLVFGNTSNSDAISFGDIVKFNTVQHTANYNSGTFTMGRMNAEVMNITGTIQSSSSSTGAVVISGGVGISGNTYVDNNVSVLKTVNSEHVECVKAGSPTFIVEGKNSINADYISGSSGLTAITTGTVAINSNMIKLNAGGKLVYDIDVDVGLEGCIRWRYKPAYDQVPNTSTQYICYLGTLGAQSSIAIFHLMSGALYMVIYDENENAIYDDALGSWFNVQNQTYEFEIDWYISASTTLVKVFIDGKQFGADITQNYGHTRTSASKITFGESATNNAISVGEISLYSSVQHSANYNSGTFVMGRVNTEMMNITATVEASSETTGSLVVNGGVGIGGNLFVAGGIDFPTYSPVMSFTGPATITRNVYFYKMGDIIFCKFDEWSATADTYDSTHFTSDALIPSSCTPSSSRYCNMVVFNNSLVDNSGTCIFRSDSRIHIWRNQVAFATTGWNGWMANLLMYHL